LCAELQDDRWRKPSGQDVALKIDPKNFLRHAYFNSTHQTLVQELANVSLEHRKEASAIRQLVCTHFVQFIGCKSRIDDIRTLLRRNEAEEADDSSATSVLIPVIEDSIARASMKERANSSNLLARQKKTEVARRALGG
jgi:hypothetical protein